MSLLSKLLFSEVIEVRDGKPVSVKGRHPRELLSEIGDVCGEFGITRGEICIKGDGRVAFYGGIPRPAYQALRNVIVNRL